MREKQMLSLGPPLVKCIMARAFCVTIADAEIGNIKSLHNILFDKYLNHMMVKFEQNRMAKPYKILCFLTENG